MRLKALFAPFVGVLLFLGAWYLLGWTVEWTRGIPFPLPPAVFERFWYFLQGELLYQSPVWEHFWMSLKRWGVGYGIALVLGFGLGVLCGRVSWLYGAGMQVGGVLQLMPGLAWIPFAMLLFGIGEKATVFMIVITAFGPVFVHTASSVRQFPQHHLQMARMLNLSRMRTLGMVVLPALAPSLLLGMRMGLAVGWRVLIAAEMVVGSSVGLGYAIIQSRWSLDFEAAFIAIGLICVVGIVSEKYLFGYVERLLHVRMGSAGI